MTHYSGYEDRDDAGDPIHGPLSQEQFRRELDRVKGTRDI
jgi:hypothetical protein